MDHKTFIQRLAASAGITHEQTEHLAAALTSAIRQGCTAGDTVAIPSFGTFSPDKTDEYVRTEADGSRTLMPPHVSVEFSASTVLRKALTHDK